MKTIEALIRFWALTMYRKATLEINNSPYTEEELAKDIDSLLIILGEIYAKATQ